MLKIPLLLALAASLIAAPHEVRLPDPERVERPAGLLWVGTVQPVPEDLAGEWSWTADGHRVWRARLRASGAHALRLRFEGFSTRGEILLYAAGVDEPAAGPYTGGGPHRDGSFWSGFVPGEAVMVEFRPAEAVPAVDALPFRLDSLARITADELEFLAGPKKPSGPRPRAIAGCHLDASCFPDVVDRLVPATAMLVGTNSQGSYSCTGFFINTKYPQENGQHWLMLTAGHCVANEEEARDLALLWRYQTETCYGDPDWEHWGSRAVYTHGARLLVSNDNSDHDFGLLALEREAISAVTRVRLLGSWSRPPRTGREVYAIGHPGAGLKRVSVGTVVPHTWGNIRAAHFSTIRWRLGSAERGSSGSPVLEVIDGEPYVIGVLVGSTLPENLDQDGPWGPYCDPDLRSVFNRLDAIYPHIESYLETPLSGTPTTPRRVSVTVTLGTTGETVTLTQADDGTWRLGDAEAASGTTTVTTSNGNTYTLVLQADGRGGSTWIARYVPERVTVRLGTSNYRITLTRAEDGTWWRGATEASEGLTILTPAGTRYRLSFVNGAWVATEVTG